MTFSGHCHCSAIVDAVKTDLPHLKIRREAFAQMSCQSKDLPATRWGGKWEVLGWMSMQSPAHRCAIILCSSPPHLWFLMLFLLFGSLCAVPVCICIFIKCISNCSPSSLLQFDILHNIKRINNEPTDIQKCLHMYTQTRLGVGGERDGAVPSKEMAGDSDCGCVCAGCTVYCVCYVFLCMHSKELINVDSCRRALRLWKCETKCNCAHISKIAGASYRKRWRDRTDRDAAGTASEGKLIIPAICWVTNRQLWEFKGLGSGSGNRNGNGMCGSLKN